MELRPSGARAWAGELLLAGPVVVVAALKVARLERPGRAMELPQLLTALRGAGRLPQPLARPECLVRATRRFLPWLPPRGMQACLKQSLILLDLWARCGLPGRLHLGIAGGSRAAGRGHAWATAPGFTTEPTGYIEIWNG